MARGVRFTKPERELIKSLLEPLSIVRLSKRDVAARESALAKLAASEAPPVKRSGGLLIRDAITAFRSVLDRRLVPPPNGAAGIFAQMQNRLNALGLTYEDCITIATQANAEWKTGSIKAQSLINQAEVLLQNATSGSQTQTTSSSQEGACEMDEL